MPSLRNATECAAIVARLDRLSPDAQPRWGRMTAPKMLAHIVDAYRMAIGELPVRRKHVPLLSMFPFKQLVIYVLPFPKNAPTAPEIVARVPDDFEVERATVKALIARLTHHVDYAEHPIFGTLSPTEWSALGYKHLDHHLRQFGA
ncbi:MAG: DUF1569 domain-containing protein [Gemmatimonadota bacterium]